MDVRVGLWRKLSTEELMLLNCGVGEDSWDPLDCKEIQPVHPKGDQSWVFIGRIDVEAEIPVIWPPHVKSWLIGKDPDAGRDWGQEEKGMTEDEMAGWHHQLDGHGFEWTLGVGDGQGGLVCCDSWGCKEWDRTEWLNWTELSANEWAEKLYDIQRSYKEKILRGLACELGLEEWPALWWTELEKKTQGVEIGSPKAGNKCDGKQCNMATD